MPSYVLQDKCDGCKALDKTACQYICPNDLMVLDKTKMKAYNRKCAGNATIALKFVLLRQLKSVVMQTSFHWVLQLPRCAAQTAFYGPLNSEMVA